MEIFRQAFAVFRRWRATFGLTREIAALENEAREREEF